MGSAAGRQSIVSPKGRRVDVNAFNGLIEILRQGAIPSFDTTNHIFPTDDRPGSDRWNIGIGEEDMKKKSAVGNDWKVLGRIWFCCDRPAEKDRE